MIWIVVPTIVVNPRSLPLSSKLDLLETEDPAPWLIRWEGNGVTFSASL